MTSPFFSEVNTLAWLQGICFYDILKKRLLIHYTFSAFSVLLFTKSFYYVGKGDG